MRGKDYLRFALSQVTPAKAGVSGDEATPASRDASLRWH